MVAAAGGIWVLDGEPANIGRLVEEVSASHRRLEALARQIAATGPVRNTRLPGWTNAHLLCHLERNAASHLRMLEAAIGGDLLDQYPGGDTGRRAEIEAGSRRSLDVLASALATTNRQLEAQWGLMDQGSWHNPTRARAGSRPAHSCLWARWREVEVHTVDLDSGIDELVWPTDFAVAGLDISFRGLELRAVADRLKQGDRLELRDPTLGSWRSHRDAEPTHAGEGPAQRLLGWLLGRSDGQHINWATGPPEIGAWP